MGMLVLKWLVVAGVFLLAAAVLPKVKVRSVPKALVAAAVFGGVNLLLGWALRLLFGAVLFLPALLSFGLAWVLVPVLVNAVLVKATDGMMGDSLQIPGLWNTLLVATALAVANGLLFHPATCPT